MDSFLVMRNEQKQKQCKNKFDKKLSTYLVVLHDLHSACIKCCGSRKTVKLIQKLLPTEELLTPVQRLVLFQSLEKQAGV